MSTRTRTFTSDSRKLGSSPPRAGAEAVVAAQEHMLGSVSVRAWVVGVAEAQAVLSRQRGAAPRADKKKGRRVTSACRLHPPLSGRTSRQLRPRRALPPPGLWLVACMFYRLD